MADPQPHDYVPRGRARKAQLSLIALLVVGLLTAVFVIQNTEDARIQFLFWSVTIPVAGALMLAAVLGSLITFLVVYVRQRQFHRAVRMERKAHGD